MRRSQKQTLLLLADNRSLQSGYRESALHGILAKEAAALRGQPIAADPHKNTPGFPPR